MATSELVWDMDGTLLDSTVVVPAAFVAAVRELGGPSVGPEQVVASRGRTRRARPARGCRYAPETGCRRSAGAASILAAVQASYLSATAVPAPPIAHPSDLHATRIKIITYQDPLSIHALA